MNVGKNWAIRLAALRKRTLSGLDQDEIESIAGHAADRVRGDPSEPLVAFARAFVEKATSIPNRFADNGERALLDRVSSLPVRTVFDVGTNAGTWSQYALKMFPEADLHAFEVVPATFSELRARRPLDPRINLNPFGLSGGAGTVAVHLYPSNLICCMSTLDTRQETTGQIDCDVERGSEYATAHGIRDIDILKIDVEGAEGKVLSEFEPMIAERRIRLIQFEYNRGAILGDFLLKHARAFLSPRGYRLGKLTPEGVHFHRYHFAHEYFVGRTMLPAGTTMRS